MSCNPTPPPPTAAGKIRNFSGLPKGDLTEIATLVVPPQTNTTCPGGRLFVSDIGPTQLKRAALDCPLVATCPTKNMITGALLPDQFAVTTEPPEANKPCGAPPPTAPLLPAFPVNLRYNDAVLARTKTGRILHAMIHGKFLAPMYPQPIWDNSTGKWVSALCSNVVQHVGIMLRSSEDCGNTWTSRFLDIDGLPSEVTTPYDFDIPVPFLLTPLGGKTTVLKLRNKEGNLYGVDRIEIYADPYTGKVFLTAGVAIPDKSKNNFGEDAITVLLLSEDDGDSWRIVDQVPGYQTPWVMTSVKAGNEVYLFAAGRTSEDLLGDGQLKEYPRLHWYRIHSTFEPAGEATVFFRESPNTPVNISVGFDPASGLDTTFSRNFAPGATLSRAPSDEVYARVRLAYPHAKENLEQIYVVQATVPLRGQGKCSGADCRVSTLNLKKIGEDLGSTAYFAHFIEPDYLEYKPPLEDQRPAPALLKFVAKPLISVGATNLRPMAIGFHGTFGVTEYIPMTPGYVPSTEWTGNSCTDDKDCGNILGSCRTASPNLQKKCYDFVGDYAYGAFFTRPSNLSELHFLVPWQEANPKEKVPQTRDLVKVREVVW